MEAASRLLRYSIRPLHRLLEKSERKAVSTRGTATPSQLFHLRRSVNLPLYRLLPALHLRSLATVPVLSTGSGFRVSSRLFPVVQGQLHVTSSPFPNSWACCPPWEMVFQGMETMMLLAEWAITELVLHTDVQAKLCHEVDAIMGTPGSIPASCSQVPRIHPDTYLLPGGWTPSAPSPNFVTATRLPLDPISQLRPNHPAFSRLYTGPDPVSEKDGEGSILIPSPLLLRLVPASSRSSQIHSPAFEFHGQLHPCSRLY